MDFGLCSVTKLIVDKDLCVKCEFFEKHKQKIVCYFTPVDLKIATISEYNNSIVIAREQRLKDIGY